jgi:hypothetical protein
MPSSTYCDLTSLRAFRFRLRIQTGSEPVTVSPTIPNMEVVSFDPSTDTLLGRFFITTLWDDAEPQK